MLESTNMTFNNHFVGLCKNFKLSCRPGEREGRWCVKERANESGAVEKSGAVSEQQNCITYMGNLPVEYNTKNTHTHTLIESLRWPGKKDGRNLSSLSSALSLSLSSCARWRFWHRFSPREFVNRSEKQCRA